MVYPVASARSLSPTHNDFCSVPPSSSATPSVVWEPSETHSSTAPLFSPPTLPSPDRFNEHSFINVMNEIHNVGEDLLKAFRHAIVSSTQKIKELSLENAQKLKEAAARAQENGVWSLLKKIGSCILSAFSIVFGIALTASGGGTLIGAALIASGIMSIANFAMTESGSWDWIAKKLAHDNEELQRKLAFWLPTAVGGISSLCSIAGSIGGTIWGGLNLAQQGFAVLQQTLGIYQLVTTVGKGISDTKLLLTQADLEEVSSKISLEKFISEDVSLWIKHCMQYLKELQKQAEKQIQLCIAANQKAIQA